MKKVKKPRAALRWFKRISLSLLVLAVLAIGAVIVFVHTGWGRDQIRSIIVTELQRDFPGSTIESMSGSPFGTIVLRGVTLNELDQTALVTIAEVRLQLSLAPLLSKRVHIDDLTISGVRAFIREHPPLTEIDAREAPPPPSLFTVELPKVTITDAQVSFETATGLEIIDQIVVHAAANVPPNASVSASATIEGRWRGKAIHAHALASIGDTVKIQVASASLGDARVLATGIEIGDYTVVGAVSAFVPAALVRELAGFSDIPGDITLVASGRPGGSVSLIATSGSARVSGELVTDLVGLTARGIVIAEAPDLAVVTMGKVAGSGTVVTAVNASLGRARGIATIIGEAAGMAGTTTLAFDTWRTSTELVASATIPLGTLSVYGYVVQREDRWVLDSSDLMVHARGVDAPFVLGRTDASFSARGTLTGEPSIDLRGTLVAAGIRTESAGAGRVSVRVKAELSPEKQHASLAIHATNISSGATRIPSANLEADVNIVGQDIMITLGDHTVKTQDGALWTGSGGSVAITASEFIVDEIQTGTGTSKITASARIGRLDSSLSAKVAARGVALAIADPTLGGTADADLDVRRRGGQWGGTVSVRGHRIAMPGRPVVDATIDVALDGRKVTLGGTVSNKQLGKATVAAVVTAPRDLTDPVAWRSLPRTAIDHVTLTFDHIDAAPLGATGTADGAITLGGTEAHGDLKVRGIVTKVGVVDVDVSFASGASGSIELHAIATTPGIAPTTIDASVVLPARPFDPGAWKLLGRGALNAATIKTAVHVDPALFARFGVTAPYEADVSATIIVQPGATGATVVADVKGLKGGRVTSPIDIHLEAVSDSTGTRADILAQSGKFSVTVAAKTPQTIAQALAPNAPPAPIEATLTIPEIAARELLGVFGQTDVLAGTFGGTVTVGGTIADPTVRALIAAKGLAMKTSSVTNKKPPTLESLVLDARYSRGHVDLTLTGQEGKDRLLKIAARADIKDPRGVVASIEAANFDLAPLAAFGTGPIRGLRGTLNAALKIKGLDPSTGSIRGKLSIKDGRMPLSPVLGTLRRATLDLEIKDQAVVAAFEGRMGAGGGAVKGKITGDLVGGLPQRFHLDLKLTKISPIGAMQPQIDAVVAGNWAWEEEGKLWSGKLTVNQARIYVPPELGNELLTTGTPPDMIFIDKHLVAKKVRKPPTRTWLRTKVAIGNTYLDIEDTDFRVRVYARGDLMVEIGNGIGVRGQIYTTRGNLDILGRRYRIDRAMVDFDDGTIDPRLDVRVVHDFKNMTLTIDVHGRASKPIPRLSGDPGSYTEGQLLSFLAGAEPSDQDSTAQQSQAAISGGLAILSGRIGRKINRYLPVKFDAISYEAGSASSSQAIRLGVQLSEKSYLVWRTHPAPRADENAGEAVFEYQLRTNMIFEATVGERSQGGDFLWLKRW